MRSKARPDARPGRALSSSSRSVALRLCSPLLALALVSCGAKAETLADGLAAYSSNHVGEAEAIFGRVANDPAASLHDRAQAWREIARIAWLVDGDANRAIRAIDRASAVGEPCPAARLRARVLDESGQAAPLVSQFRSWIALCKDAQAQDEIRYRAADALLAAADRSPRRDALLGEAAGVLASIGADEATDLQVATLRLELALARSDAAAATEAWKDYYWLTDADGPPALAAEGARPAARFERGLAPRASTRDRLLLLDLLTRAGFARPAERLVRQWGLEVTDPSDPLWRKISAYLAERRKLEAILLASNRRVARGGKAADLRAAVRSMQEALAAAAGIQGDLRPALAKTYGLYRTAGQTGGFESVHLGHLVQSDRRQVEQYGRRAEVSYLVIDNMIANGYESWLWDGEAADGGWTEPGPVIVQARPEYTKAPLDAWMLVANARHRVEYLERLKSLEGDDLKALRSADVAYLPGLARRLNLQLAAQVLDRARRVSGTPGDVQRAFLAEYWRANLQQSIFIHEGRHALDLHLVSGDTAAGKAELEYRAKLSELALADYPRLALINVDGATIGGDNEHGRANRRIMAEYGAWISAHRKEVEGYDAALPPLVQLDRLTDDQIRAVARTRDPFARQPLKPIR